MPTDFAKRSTTPSRPRKKAKKRRTLSPKPRVLFHGPSFSSGAIVGAAVVILAAYAPEWLQTAPLDDNGQPQQSEKTPTLHFDFPTLLPESDIKADPSAYPVPDQTPNQIPKIFNIQAASFREADDANALRARLILENLPAFVDTSLVDDRVWFRVKVGPFSSKTLANRAMTRLREMYLTPIWMNNHN